MSLHLFVIAAKWVAPHVPDQPLTVLLFKQMTHVNTFSLRKNGLQVSLKPALVTGVDLAAVSSIPESSKAKYAAPGTVLHIQLDVFLSLMLTWLMEILSLSARMRTRGLADVHAHPK